MNKNNEQDAYPMRINKYMSRQKMCSRREADRLIDSGCVYLNGRSAALGDKVNEGDEVKIVEGVMIDRVYLAYNKPVGIITHSPGPDEECITDIIETDERVFPIGRLDKDSHGLIILTNDGLVTKRLLDPENEKEKEYIVKVNKAYNEDFLYDLSEGVELDDGYTTKPCKVGTVDDTTFIIVLTEGKKRQIRRMCEALGYNVVDLQRTRIANIELGDVPTGEYREIKGTELKDFLSILNL